ncbi:hypothetical protein ACFQH9_22340 [Pseudonocardia lutea]|jgi:hypothetical protein|uniref:Uncharacterized protein n=1 Tax=Pseudonocardia lutea TaxID=2172015 RepID=A0ABW1IC69_9PSEU
MVDGAVREDAHSWGASGWGCNAREPWAAPRFVAPRPAGAARPTGGAGPWLVVVTALLAALLAGAAGVYLLEAVVAPAG